MAQRPVTRLSFTRPSPVRHPRPLPPPSLRAALAAAFGFAAAPAAYAWVRALEASMFPRANPLAIVAVTQSGFFARCGVAALVAGMAAFAGWALAARPVRAARALVVVVVLASAALALQTGVAP
jgi:hypothetical protein